MEKNMGNHSKNKKLLTKEDVKQKLSERKKLSKKLLKEKRARLIVKNLPFKATEENLKEYFEKYGEIDNVQLLRKPDGKLVGCGFIQFKLVQKSAKAKHHTNGKDFLGRKLLVDFAKSKKKYDKEIKSKQESSAKQNDKSQENQPEDEILSDQESVDKSAKVSSSDISDDEEETHISENEITPDKATDDSKFKTQVKNYENAKTNPNLSHDLVEGKTIFVKNVPFTATNQDLKQCMLQFGRVYYALICTNKLTEYSKGTAFVKFLEKEDAEKALNAGTELTLLGNILDCHPALNRSAIQKKIVEKKEIMKEPKDSRNLYLVREGVILAGSHSADGVSASDMAKRLQIEQYKTQMLRNLNMFVSKERIVVHNLPPTWDDKKLGILFQKYGGPGAVVREARIMRDMKNVDAKGIGNSKEYGFVGFTKHENALAALRNLNNNPNIFSAQKRPIITFSIENKSMLKAKQRRMEKSKLNNPKKEILASTIHSEQKPKGSSSKKNKQRERNTKRTIRSNLDNSEFEGITSQQGVQQKMRSRNKLMMQAKLHLENLKTKKKRDKNLKKSLMEKRKDFTKQPKQKVNKGKDNDNFSKLVNEYKKKLNSVTNVEKSKWYD